MKQQKPEKQLTKRIDQWRNRKGGLRHRTFLYGCGKSCPAEQENKTLAFVVFCEIDKVSPSNYTHSGAELLLKTIERLRRNNEIDVEEEHVLLTAMRDKLKQLLVEEELNS